MDIDDIYIKIEKDADFECGKKTNDEKIKEAEKELGVAFPDEYRQMIKKYGYLCWSATDVFGISDDEYFDTASRTKKKKEMDVPNEYEFPEKGNIIAEYAGGGFYFLYGENSSSPGVVIECLDETWWKPERKWNTFREYLEGLLGR